MLTFFLEKRSRTALYEQLYTQIKKAIENNLLHINEKLPSKRKLANHLKISQTTVETAYMQLLAEGYIKSVPKVGFFVATNIDLPNKIKKKEIVIQMYKEKTYLYDFKTNQIDANNFPYEKFARIEREIMLDKFKDNVNRGDIFGNFDFRKKISEILFSYRGINASYEQIVIGSGSEHLISLIVLLLGRDKVYAVEDPSYVKNYYLYQAYGVKVKPIGLDEEGISIDRLQKESVDVIHTTPSHQFPKGIVTSINRRMELLRYVKSKNDRYIIEDDYDSEFRFFGNPIPAMQGLDNEGKVIYMNSFSKTLAPSFRISFMVLPDKLARLYREKFSFFSCSVPTIDQLVLERFISIGEYDKHLNRMKTNYKSKRDTLISLLENSKYSDKIKIYGEESGLHFLVDIKTEITEFDLVEKAKKEGVRVYGLYEYSLEKCVNQPIKTIVFGYSNMSKIEMEEACMRLEIAWKNI
jgi:GntR family transcriptional regulator/MocR family aminotransferase